MNNIFNFAPKELVQDAFLCWCFNFSESENEIEREFTFRLAQEIYNHCGGNKKLDIQKVTPKTQETSSKIDVLVQITLANEEKLYFVFENKLETSHHSNQLIRHKEEAEKKYPGEKKYIYFKIGYLFEEDMELPNDYTLIDRKTILSILDKVKIESEIFNSYYNFLLEMDKKDKLETKLIEEDRKLTREELDKVFWSQSGQYKILKKLQSKIKSKIDKGTSFGRPWTNITILSDENIKDHWRGVFWRVDWRINKETKAYTPYICLRYYKTFLEKIEEDEKYFQGMRQIFNDLAEEYNNLKFGKVHNIGNKEREIGILYFDNEKNTIPRVIKEVEGFTEKFLKKVKERKMYYEDVKYNMNFN